MTQTNFAYRGSDDDVPVAGTPDHSLWMGTINRKIQEFAGDTKHTWSSLFNLDSPNELGTVATTGTTTLTGTSTYFTDYQPGDKLTVDGETERIIDTVTSDTVLTVTVAFTNTVTANTFTHTTIIKTGVQSYNLHRNFINPSDFVTVSATQDHNYQVDKPQERDQNDVYITGIDPKAITFYADIPASVVGGELQVPGYYKPLDLTDDTDVIPCDDPYWVVYAVASELSFNDLTYEAKTPALNAKANNLYHQMVTNNRRGTPRVLKTNVNRIPGVR